MSRYGVQRRLAGGRAASGATPLRAWAVTAACTAFLLAAFTVAVGLGASGWSFGDLWRALLAPLPHDDSALVRTVLLEIRLPRVAAAALCGGSLAAAGVLSQGLFRNSLAGPSVLGTEAGGSFAAVAMFYAGGMYQHWLLLPAAAFMGALGATLFVLRLATRPVVVPVVTLLLAGFTLNAVFGALTSLVVSLSLDDYQKSGAVLRWLLGGFSGKGWEHVAIGTVPLVVGGWTAWVLAPRLDVLALGADIAATLSIDQRTLRRATVLALALLVGGAIAAGGALPFVGLIVPHATRLVAGPAHRRLLGLSLMNGMSLAMLADVVARTVRAPAELEVGILTSLLGAPFFLWLLLRPHPGAGGAP